MNRLQRRRATWLAIVALAAAPLIFAPQAWVASAPRASSRLVGPLLPLVATVQWVRVDAAMQAGRPELALARAQSLFELEPHSGDARVFVSMYLAFRLASPERELDATKRAAWLRAAVDVVERGEPQADAPAELALWAGELLARAADNDPQIAWNGGVRGLWRDAAQRYERAAKLGHRLAAKRLSVALARADGDD